jgi:hypothetical protein
MPGGDRRVDAWDTALGHLRKASEHFRGHDANFV